MSISIKYQNIHMIPLHLPNHLFFIIVYNILLQKRISKLQMHIPIENFHTSMVAFNCGITKIDQELITLRQLEMSRYFNTVDCTIMPFMILL